jgi:hypothetical protein
VLQAIGLVQDIFWPAALLSAAVALAAAWRLPRMLPAALAIGFAAGYLALPRSWAAIVPQQELHWLPYLGVAAAATALSGYSPAQLRWPRWSAIIGLTIVAACLLTPSWPVFGATRPLSIAIATAYFLLIAAPLEQLPQRLLNQTFAGVLALAAAITAVAIGIQVSLRFAQLSALAAGGLAGCSLAGFLGTKPTDSAIRSLIPIYTVLVGGIALLACVEPDPPATLLLALPFTPLLPSLGSIRRHPLASKPEP